MGTIDRSGIGYHGHGANMIPWQAKEILREMLAMPHRRRAAALNEAIKKAPSDEPVLGFGGLLDGEGLIHGGAVKLLSLRDGFRHNEDEFNVLYLVSSAQPRFAEDLVRGCHERGIKFVWNQNGVGYPAWAGRDMDRHNEPMRRLRSLADFVIYQSEFCRSSAETFLGSCDKPSTILLNPVDLVKFTPRTHPLPARPLRLLAMGTQNYRDRVVNALDCLRSLQGDGVECTLTIAGPLIWKNAERDLHTTIESMRLAGSVKTLPPFRQDEAADIYRAHHVLLHPKYMDPCPTVVAEALACGLPVVASRSGGMSEMVDGSCSRLIEVHQSWDRLFTPSGRELAQAVVYIAQDLHAFLRAARCRAELLFDAETWRERHADIFRSLLVAR
ncbi:MAG: glycosyltransferase family 4 protein [Verrucomicrobiota bacterium]